MEGDLKLRLKSPEVLTPEYTIMWRFKIVDFKTWRLKKNFATIKVFFQFFFHLFWLIFVLKRNESYRKRIKKNISLFFNVLDLGFESKSFFIVFGWYFVIGSGYPYIDSGSVDPHIGSGSVDPHIFADPDP